MVRRPWSGKTGPRAGKADSAPLRMLRGAGGTAGLVASVALGLAACGSPTASAPTTQTTPVTTSPPSSTTSTTTPQQAVIAGWVAAQNAFEQASLAVNPADPDLAATMVNPELQQVRAVLEVEQYKHDTARGHQDLGHPAVVSYSPTRAVVHSCMPGPGIIVYQPNGQPEPTPLGQASNDDVTDVMVPGPAGTWLDQSTTVNNVPACPQ